MIGRAVTGVYALYSPAGSGRFLLNGDQRLALDEGKLVPTPGLTAGPGGWCWTATSPLWRGWA